MTLIQMLKCDALNLKQSKFQKANNEPELEVSKLL